MAKEPCLKGLENCVGRELGIQEKSHWQREVKVVHTRESHLSPKDFRAPASHVGEEPWSQVPGRVEWKPTVDTHGESNNQDQQPYHNWLQTSRHALVASVQDGQEPHNQHRSAYDLNLTEAEGTPSTAEGTICLLYPASPDQHFFHLDLSNTGSLGIGKNGRTTPILHRLGPMVPRQMLGLPRTLSHTYLIQKAIVQGQIGGRIGGKDGGCLLGSSHCQFPICVVL